MRFLFSILAASCIALQSTPAHAQHQINNTPGFVDFCNNLVVGFIDMVGGFDSPRPARPPKRTAPAPQPVSMTPKELQRHLVSDPIIGEQLAACAEVLKPASAEAPSVK